MQNSLDRLFDGITRALMDTVIPVLDDTYARAQVLACVELLRNLAVRVEWRRDHLRDEIERARPILVAAGTRSDLVASAIPDEAPGLVELHRAHLESLAQAARSDDPRIWQMVAAFSAWHLEREFGLLKTGMYKS